MTYVSQYFKQKAIENWSSIFIKTIILFKSQKELLKAFLESCGQTWHASKYHRVHLASFWGEHVYICLEDSSNEVKVIHLNFFSKEVSFAHVIQYLFEDFLESLSSLRLRPLKIKYLLCESEHLKIMVLHTMLSQNLVCVKKRILELFTHGSDENI